MGNKDIDLGFTAEDVNEELSNTGRERSELSQVVSNTFEKRLEILRRAIEDIDSEIGLRLGMNKSFQDTLHGERKWIGFKLSQFDRWHWGDKPSVDFRRTTLERELLAIYREMRTQSQRAFTDIAGLKKERRKLVVSSRIKLTNIFDYFVLKDGFQVNLTDFPR